MKISQAIKKLNEDYETLDRIDGEAVVDPTTAKAKKEAEEGKENIEKVMKETTPEKEKEPKMPKTKDLKAMSLQESLNTLMEGFIEDTRDHDFLVEYLDNYGDLNRLEVTGNDAQAFFTEIANMNVVNYFSKIILFEIDDATIYKDQDYDAIVDEFDFDEFTGEFTKKEESLNEELSFGDEFIDEWGDINYYGSFMWDYDHYPLSNSYEKFSNETGVWIEPSIQGREGSVFVYDKDDELLKEFDVYDFEELMNDIVYSVGADKEGFVDNGQYSDKFMWLSEKSVEESFTLTEDDDKYFPMMYNSPKEYAKDALIWVENEGQEAVFDGTNLKIVDDEGNKVPGGSINMVDLFNEVRDIVYEMYEDDQEDFEPGETDEEHWFDRFYNVYDQIPIADDDYYLNRENESLALDEQTPQQRRELEVFNRSVDGKLDGIRRPTLKDYMDALDDEEE